MDFAILFRASGRMNRAQYWIFGILLSLFANVLVGLVALNIGAIGFPVAKLLVALNMGAAAANRGPPVIYLLGVLAIVFQYSYTAVGIKRLHDRGKSGYWVLPFLYWPYVVYGVTSFGGKSPMLSLAGLVLGVWAFRELYCLRGTVGTSAYGPDPVG